MAGIAAQGHLDVGSSGKRPVHAQLALEAAGGMQALIALPKLPQGREIGADALGWLIGVFEEGDGGMGMQIGHAQAPYGIQLFVHAHIGRYGISPHQTGKGRRVIAGIGRYHPSVPQFVSGGIGGLAAEVVQGIVGGEIGAESASEGARGAVQAGGAIQAAEDVIHGGPVHGLIGPEGLRKARLPEGALVQVHPGQVIVLLLSPHASLQGEGGAGEVLHHIGRAVGGFRLHGGGMGHRLEHHVEDILDAALGHGNRHAVLQVLRALDQEHILPCLHTAQAEGSFFVRPGFRHIPGILIQTHPGVFHGVSARLGKHLALHSGLLGPQKGGHQKTQDYQRQFSHLDRRMKVG